MVNGLETADGIAASNARFCGRHVPELPSVAIAAIATEIKTWRLNDHTAWRVQG
jgi:hypothetical protein